MVRIGFRFGTTVYGKTDIAPGLFYVGTRFLHLYSFPLMPLGSVLAYENSKYLDWTMVLLSTDRVCASKDIAFSAKSLIAATARVILLGVFSLSLAGIPLLLSADGFTSEYPAYLSVALLATLVSGGLLYWSYSSAIATRERALALGALAGFSEDLVLRHLEFRGYPLRRPKKAFHVKRCTDCHELWPLQLGGAEPQSALCPKCNASALEESHSA